MVGTVQSSSSSSCSLKDFEDGKINLTKTDLANSVISAEKAGKQPSSEVMDIIDSYDKIDKNADGISYSELETYKNSTAGILSTMGLSPQSIAQENNNITLSLLSSMSSGEASSTSNSSDSLLSSLLSQEKSAASSGSASSTASILSNLLGSSSSSATSSSESSILSSFLQSYVSSSSSSSSSEALSLVDYLS